MLTPRGRSVVALALGLAVGARVLALREMAMIGAALLAVLGSGLVTVIGRRLTLAVGRRVSPARTTVGGNVRVELAIANRGTTRGGPLLLEDALPVGLSAPARLTLPVLGPRSERRVAYTLRPQRRGVFRIGPLDLLLTDAFGLFIRRQEVPLGSPANAKGPRDSSATIVVYPSFDRLRTMPRDIQRSSAIRRSPLLGTGDEFYTLREYTEGDDLRKVHWTSSMRTGNLLVRQEELLELPRILVVLDTCAAKHRGEGARSSLEAAISACASVAALAVASRMSVEILAAGGPITDGRRPTEDEVLEALALLEPGTTPDMGPALVRWAGKRSPYTALVVITPGLSEREAAMLADLASRAPGGAAVHVDAQSFASVKDADPRLRRPRFPAVLGKLGLPVVGLASGDSFVDVWEAGVRGVAVRR